MLFNSLTYILFFAAVFLMYYLFPRRFQWLVLFVSSLVFYMVWSVKLTILLVLATASNFILSLFIEKISDSKKRKSLLIASLIINFGVLFIFKYMVFINQTLIGIFGHHYPLSNFNIILPLGISFYTFQAVGYTIDVYRGKINAEKNYLKYNLFITFFPPLVAGPIERAGNLMHQLSQRHNFSYKNLTTGVQLMLMGFFKKMVIADRASVVVNTVFNSPNYYSSFYYLIAIFLFAFQIYCDFSGYSLIAVGSAKVLGIDLTNNFDAPYFSKSIKEFWRRWHISLSSWFKDYVYFPLGGNRVSKLRANFNVFVTFMLSGIWHGANWTFLVWGALHGVYQIIGNLKNYILKRYVPFSLSNKLTNFICGLFTFALVCFAWIFFRANTFSDAIYIVTHLFWDFKASCNIQSLYNILCSLGISLFELIFLMLAIVTLVITEAFRNFKKSAALTFVFNIGLVIAIFSLGVFTSGGEFIYFQF